MSSSSTRDEKSREAERMVRLVENAAYQWILSQPNLGKNRPMTESLLRRYQKRVCRAVWRGMAETTPKVPTATVETVATVAQGSELRYRPIDWVDFVSRRRFSVREMHRRGTEVGLRRVQSGAMFGHLLAQLRYDTWTMVAHTTCAEDKRNCDHFASFFFCLRSFYMAWYEQRLYSIHATVGQEALVVGFLQVSLNTDTGPYKRKPGGKRKRSLTKRSLWVDFFQIFADFRQLGIGQLAAQQLPNLVQQDFEAHNPSFIRLSPIEPAEAFWKKCGYRWSAPKYDEGHLQLRYAPKRRKI